MEKTDEIKPAKTVPWVSLTVGKVYRAVLRASDAAAGRVFKAILRYAADEVEPCFKDEDPENLLFGLFVEDIDSSIEVYWRKVEGGRYGGNKAAENRRNALESPKNTDSEHGKPQGVPRSPIGEESDSSTQDIDRHITLDDPNRQTDKAPGVKGYTVDQIRTICREKGIRNVDPERIVEVNESRGWLVDGKPIRDITAYLRSWSRHEKSDESITASGSRQQHRSDLIGPNGVAILPEDEQLHDLDELFS